jgi:flagellar biosynthesis protein
MNNQHKKPIKKAAAIKYDVTDSAPQVIAKGKGIVAQNILDKADESTIPIYKDEELADTLTKLDIGEYIPPELYKIVAEIMIFVSDLDEMRDKLI